MTGLSHRCTKIILSFSVELLVYVVARCNKVVISFPQSGKLKGFESILDIGVE